MPPTRVVEEIRGEGDVWDGTSKVGRAAYVITVDQSFARGTHLRGSGREFAGMNTITGSVRFISQRVDVSRLMDGTLTLHLADGRLWDFSFDDEDGAAIGAGAIREP